ncbi:MAG: FkbM family methyltransferase [Nanoarchaeota archaeon]|nr:FkbM family methyltransferase [Nanoarchaeota archaeon]
MKIKNILEHSFVGNFLNEKSLVVDLGANKGEFSNAILEAFGCEVYAVEPIPDLYKGIKERSGLRKFQACITRRSGKTTLNLPKNRCGTIYPASGEDAGFLEVLGINFNDFMRENAISSIDLLKVDIEGAEIDVFETITDENLKKIKQMTIEFHDFLYPEMRKQVKAIKKEMRAKGFVVVSFSFFTNGDVLCVRKNMINAFWRFYLIYFVKYILGAKRVTKRIFRTIAE